MMDLPSGTSAVHEATTASVRAVESAVALARAEMKLVVARAHSSLLQVVVLALGVIVAVSFAQAALVLGALAPLITTHGDAGSSAQAQGFPWPFVASLALSLGIAGLAGLVARAAFKRLKNGGTNADRGDLS